VHVADAVWQVATKIVAGVADLVQRMGDGRTSQVLDGRTIKRLSELCAVCTVHDESRSASFLVEPQNQGQWFVSGLASKPLGRFVSGLASKTVGRFVSGLASKQVG
jgi:hypothetical protein